MFKYLMDNAIASQSALNLSVGVGLSGEQVAALTHDIVWMKDQVVRGEHVLVPVLYLAQANNRLAANGALIQGNELSLIAGNNLNIAAAANESHYYSKTKKVTAQEDHVSQVGSQLTAGGSAALSAGQDIILTASGVKAGGEAYLYAGNELNLLAAQNYDYSLYDMKKKGSFGAKKTQRDEVTDIRHVGSQITTGGDLLLVSEGNQRYQAAKLNSGNDLTLQSGGAIAFEGVKDLHQESHEKSKSDLAWNSMKGKGSTDETVRQSQMIAQGEVAIRAVEGLQIDVKQVDQQTVSQAIDAMVKTDPQLAWLKEAEKRGDVDWRQVEEIHQSFKYNHSGLGVGAQLVIAILMAAFLGPAAMTAFGAAGTGVAAAGSAISVSAATTASISAVNNRGNLGAVFKDVTSSDAIKGYAIAGTTAGLTAGYFDDWTGTHTDVASGKVVGPKLYTWEGVGQFAANQTLQSGTSMALGKALGQGGSTRDALQSALFNTLAAASFNAVGDYTVDIPNGSLQKVAIHAMVGGLLSTATGGDFRTGALAAGANEALVVHLNKLVDGNETLLTMSSQIVGLVAAASQDDVDVEKLEKATWVAKNATQYNFLGDHSAKKRDEVREKFRREGTAQQARELVSLEGADHRSDNLLEAYKRDPASLNSGDLAELTAYLQVYVYEQARQPGGEQAAQINLDQLLNGSRVPVYGFPFAGRNQDKVAWAESELGTWGKYTGRDKSPDQQTYESAKGLLLIDQKQRDAAEVGSPALYFLAGPLGGAIRAAAATNGALQFAQGTKQAVEGDTWNAAGNMVLGALGMATVGIPKAATGMGKEVSTAAGGKTSNFAQIPKGERGERLTYVSNSSAPEIRERLSSAITDIRRDLPLGGNAAFAEIKIDALSKEILVMKSFSQYEVRTGEFLPKPAGNLESWLLKPQRATSRYIDTPEAYLRDMDTEFKILETIAQRLGNNSAVAGRINLMSEKMVCPSCSGVINQFRDRYPNIQLNVFTVDK
ncbi:hypothetical protein PS3A_30430 [Pseudomonas sp. 3A(2025)]